MSSLTKCCIVLQVESPSVASRLEKLKESQARVEQLSSLLSVFKTGT